MSFYVAVSLVYLEKNRYVILGDKMDFANILQSIKTKKSVKYLKLRVTLDSPRTVWQVFDTFCHLLGQTKLRSSIFGDNEWQVRR